METQIENNPEPIVEEQKKDRHHRHHRHSSSKSVSKKTIYRTTLIIIGFILIGLSISEEEILLALSGSLLLMISLLFTDVYKKTARTFRKFILSISNSAGEQKEHSHRRHHRRH